MILFSRVDRRGLSPDELIEGEVRAAGGLCKSALGWVDGLASSGVVIDNDC